MAKFDAGDRQVPIRVQLEDSARSDLQMLQQLRVPLGQRGERGGVPLSVVADIQLDQGPTSINRYDRERQATVAADLVGTAALGDATKMIYDLPVMKSLPKGVKVSPSGDAESLAELSDGFATAITAGLMMVYAVLVLLFGTFLQPITILFSLPLSIGGAIAALLLTGKQLTTPVWIGILMLMGIVTKNAIMLVEFAVEAIREGKKRDEAIIDAGMKRARPIVMTTIAMAAGMMPSALAFGAGGEFRSPMALAVIGGLIFSTILSLVFVPAMFMVMDDLGALCWRFGQKLLVSSGEAEEAGHGSDHHEPPGQGPAGGAAGDVARGREARRRGLAMANISAAKTFTAIVSVAALGAAISFSSGAALAQDKNVTEDQIVRALAPEKKPLTRGLSTGPQHVVDPAVTAAEGKFVQKIRGRSTRSLSSAEREEIAAIVKDKPKIDLEINFDYNSADISAKSLPSVQALGRALTNNDLKGSTFVVAGHTDAAGGETYNQDLSERRADAIKRYLVDKYGINGTDLVTVGYGKSKLKDPGQPMAEVNRRVQVVNMENKATASNAAK